MTVRSLIASLIVTVLALGAPAVAQPVEGVAAIVNDEPITNYDVRQRMALIIASTGVQPDQQILRQVQNQALQTLINEHLQLQLAASYNVEITDEEIADALDRLGQQNGVNGDAIVADLSRAGVDPDSLRKQLEADIAWNAVVSGLYGARTRVSDDQINDALELLAESVAKPSFLLSEIVLDPPPGATAEQINAGVTAIIRQLQQGASFPAVARQFSASPSASIGGDIGWVRAAELPDEIASVVAQMSPGQVSTPIETDQGIYLIAVRDVREPADVTRVTLRQVLAPVPAGTAPDVEERILRNMERVVRDVEACDDVDSVVARRLEGAIVSNLGEVTPSDLSPDVREAIESVDDGSMSAPLRTPAGYVSLAVCDRSLATGDLLPSRDQIERRLINEQLGLASRRLLQTERRRAMIETKVR